MVGRDNASLPDLEKLADKAPERSTALAEWSAHLAGRLVAKHRTGSRQELAVALNALSYRLRELGRSEEALAAVAEAVDLRRNLAGDDPDQDLALSLANLGSALGAVGRSADGLAASSEQRGDRGLPDLERQPASAVPT